MSFLILINIFADFLLRFIRIVFLLNPFHSFCKIGHENLMHIKLLFFKVCSNVRYINVSVCYVSVFRRYYPPFKQSGSDQESQPISFLIFIVPLLKNILFVVINIDVNCLLSFQVYFMILVMPSVLSVSLS